VGRTVLVVDDHAEFRSVARAVLESDGFDVVGEAADGAEALASAARLRPQLVLLDIQLPDIDGFAVAERLAATGAAAPAVVLVSSRSAGAYRRRLADTPARGFLSKADLTGAAVRGLLDPD
jgi:CheY-like chemotaxis protein